MTKMRDRPRALIEWIRHPEVIGPPDCPILHRWTVVNANKAGKLLVHHFMPNADDPDCHDHPRPFVTLVLQGGYRDLRHDGSVEFMRPGMVRFRRAEHAHRTLVSSRGCWTIVVMGPLVRAWGFWRDGRWYQWRTYERIFGFSMRCD